MADNKTKATHASVARYLEAIDDPARRKDCRVLAKLMAKATNQKPRMWGTSIVGFGSYHYKYDSGREGDSCVTGFSSRTGDISIYPTAGFPGREDLLAALGQHKVGKACVYIRRLADVDLDVLERVVVASYEDRIKNHS